MSQNTSQSDEDIPIADRTPYAYLDDDGEVFIPGTYRRPVDNRSLWLVSEADIRREVARELDRLAAHFRADAEACTRRALPSPSISYAAGRLDERAKEVRNG